MYEDVIGKMEPESIPKRKREELLKVLETWSGLHAYMQTLPAKDTSLDTLLMLLSLETRWDGVPRPYIVDRIYSRFSNLRRQIETQDLAMLSERVQADAA